MNNFHPIVTFSFFLIVIIASIVILDPLLIFISLFFSFFYSILLNGKRAAKFNLAFALPSALLIMIINPIFNSQGSRILFYLFENPVTLESIIYGITSGMMLACIVIWFSCYNTVMTSDKFIYLFGKAIPSLSLIFSMVLRFVPRFRDQAKVIANSQKCIGKDISQGNLFTKIKNGTRILSILITWALENAIDTADSMRARGYGLSGRTSFAIFKMETRDKVAVGLIFVAAVLLIYSNAEGLVGMGFFPVLDLSIGNPIGYVAFFALCLLPFLSVRQEGGKYESV